MSTLACWPGEWWGYTGLLRKFKFQEATLSVRRQKYLATKSTAFLIDWSSSEEAGGSVFLIGPRPLTWPEVE